MNNASKLFVIAAIAASSVGAAFADEADGSQNVLAFHGDRTRAEVQAELQQYRQAGVNPWSTSYNQLGGFRSEKTRADVRTEFLASRDEAAALKGEDSGATYLAQHRAATPATVLAGQPVNNAN